MNWIKYYFYTFIFGFTFLQAQNHSPKVSYDMQIDVDAKNYQYKGEMDFTFENHAPNALNQLYFHLYFNAFQPGSVMDERLKSIADPDRRMVKNLGTNQNPKYESKIANLKPNEMGYQKIKSITHLGKELTYTVKGTLLEVALDEPLASGDEITLHMNWDAQVPLSIRRSGRKNAEGIEFSMTQWYPKAAMYDESGWHLDEYIAREFYAPFGDFEVEISIDKDYIVAASGKLQNPHQVKGYSATAKLPKNGKATWKFKAKNIHDFAWSADPDYVVDQQQVPYGPMLYFVYDQNLTSVPRWKKMQPYTVQFFEYMNEHFGAYPWETYTVAQGGDGGMEYGTITLITGKRGFDSLVGVTFHEAAHSWFQHLFATDETQNEWMDEGFTSYAEAMAYAHIFGLSPNAKHPHEGAYQGYNALAKSGVEEPMSLLADYYTYNFAYGQQAYSKGQVTAAQLGYIIGEENLAQTFKNYYTHWKFKHPKPTDFQKIAQDVSGINLKWYFNLWLNSTRFIDYGVSVKGENEIVLENKSDFPMPLDILVTYQDGKQELFYIPTHAMRNGKPFEKQIYGDASYKELDAWGWPLKQYAFKTQKSIEKVEIDPSGRLADIVPENNVYPQK